MKIIKRFESFYQELDLASVAQLGELYAEQVHFIDPVTEHHGLEQLCDYFEQLLQRTQSCTFAIQHIFATEEQANVQWLMNYQHPRLAGGKPLSLDGCSLIRWQQERIYYQRDYYDLGAMLYEQIPLLGAVVRKIKRGLST